MRKDVIIDWLGKPIGKFLTEVWNTGQRKGNMALLELCVSGHRFMDAVVWLPIFFGALFTLWKEDVDHIIDAQIMCTSAILKAIRVIKYWKGKEILLEKVVTELPTELAIDFFKPIKRLSLKDKKYLRINTTSPLLNPNYPDANAFWKANCNMTEAEIHYDTLPIRPAFLEYAGQKQSGGPLTLDISTADPNETHLLHRAISFGPGKAKRMRNTVTYTIDANDKVTLLMLGANPHEAAVLEYLDHFIQVLQKKNYKTRKDHLFISCKNQEKIVERLRKTNNFPKSLTVLPIPYQDDHVIAPLFHRSDATITRSGGLTSMELLTVSNGIIWIHRGSPPKHLPSFFLNRKTIKEGMPPWERGNANYLQVKKGAHFITPQTFREVTETYFSDEFDCEISGAASTFASASTRAPTQEPCKS